MFPVNGSLLVAPPFPRSGPGKSGSPTVVSTMKALRLPARAFPVTYLVRFRAPHDSPMFVLAFAALPCRRRTCARARAIVQPADPSAGLLSCGRERDLSGSQAIHPVPLPRSKTPAEPTVPRHWRFRRCCLRSNDSEGFSMRSISRLLRGFSTCCLRFKNGVAATPCKTRFRLAGWPLPGGS